MDRIDDSELAHLFEWTSMALEYYEAIDVIRSKQMSIKYATALIKAGEVMPSEVAAVICKEYSTGYGYAIAFEGVMEIGKELGEVEPDSLAQLLEANKPATKLLWFCKSDNPLHEDDLQPFVGIDDQIAMCFTGDFSQYAQAGSAHTNEALAAEKIRAKLLKLWKSNDSDMATFDAALANPEEDDTVETMVGWVPENSAIAFLMASGRPAGFAKPEDREQEHPWGWTYGAPETAKVEAPKPAPAPSTGKVTFSLKKKTDTTTATDQTTKPESEKTDILSGRFVDVRSQSVKFKGEDYPFELALNQDGVTSISVMDSDVLTRPPADKDNKDRLQAYYKEQLGYCPHNWKRRPWIKPKGSTTVVKLADIQNKDKSSTSTAALQTAKDTTNKFVPPPKVVSKEVVKHFLEVDFPKILGNNSEFIQNPDKIWAEAEKEPDILAMLNDKRFLTLDSLDFSDYGRHLILDHIGGPETAFWKTFVNVAWRSNIIARRSANKRLVDANNSIANLTATNTALVKEIETLKAGNKAEPTKPAGNTGKVTFSLKKQA